MYSPKIFSSLKHGSASPGCEEVQSEIQKQQPDCAYVTLRQRLKWPSVFHLKNGAEVYKENADTVNYLYR
jgi:hypothetical protein